LINAWIWFVDSSDIWIKKPYIVH